MKSFYLIKITKNYGRHTEVYVDFENEIIKHNKSWKTLNSAHIYWQELFNRIIFPFFKYGVIVFNFPSFHKKRLFAIISGTQYCKIFFSFSFRALDKVLYIFDAWPSLNKINENAIKSYKIKTVFFSSIQATNYFNKLKINGFNAFWIPEGIDSSKYKFLDYLMKDIDIVQYGRQWDWLHNEIFSFCVNNSINYEFPLSEDFLKTQFSTRDKLVNALSRSKIAVCVPRNISHPDLAKEISTLTTRYFECMSSKCLIWGHAPQELIELFGYNPVIEIDYKNPRSQLLEILSSIDLHKELIEKNYNTVINHHQWKNRINEINKILDSK